MINPGLISIVCTAYLLSFNYQKLYQPHTSLYLPDNNKIEYAGRIDFTNPQKPRLISSGACFTVKFRGKNCSILLEDQSSYNNHSYISIVIDGEYSGRIKVSKDKTEYPVAMNLKGKAHTLMVCKDTESQTGYIDLAGIFCIKLLRVKKNCNRKIEFIGNSITCGMGMDISEIPCDSGEWYDQHNAYLAYGPLVARELKADWLLSSVSGIGITRYWNSPGPTMPETYNKIYLNKDSASLWNPGNFMPDLVSVCLGTNDFSDGDGSYDRPPLDSAEFVKAYISFLETIRSKYPDAQICCLSSPMLDGRKNVLMHNYLSAVIKYMKEIRKDKMIHMFEFSRPYTNGCSYHPDKEDHKKMAEELFPFFKNVMNW
jgi:lysophospholipase L1-like esterase